MRSADSVQSTPQRIKEGALLCASAVAGTALWFFATLPLGSFYHSITGAGEVAYFLGMVFFLNIGYLFRRPKVVGVSLGFVLWVTMVVFGPHRGLMSDILGALMTTLVPLAAASWVVSILGRRMGLLAAKHRF